MVNSTRIEDWKPTIPTHPTQGRFPFIATQSLRQVFPSNAIQYGHRKVTFLLSIGLNPHQVHMKSLGSSSLVPFEPF